MQLTLQQSLTLMSTLGTAWLMVQMGVGKRMLRIKRPDKCASCGRLRTRGRCDCSSS
jgi:hypothetical protein